MAVYFEILCAIIILYLVVYYYYATTYNFWKSRGVVGPPPQLFFGNIKDVMLGKTSMAMYLQKVYNEYQNEQVIGLYMRKPTLLLRDPEIIEEVLITQFSKYSERGTDIFEKTEPLSRHIANLGAETWRPLRSKLSQAFTHAKIKSMFPDILKCAQHLEKHLEMLVKKGEPIECCDFSEKFTLNVINSFAFGVDADSQRSEDIAMRRKGKELFERTLENLTRFKMRHYTPWLYNFIGYIAPEKNFTTFFTRVLKTTMKYREENGIERQDLIDALIKLKNHPEELPNIDVTDTFLAAQMVFLYGAGFKASSGTISNALLELALNQQVQDKLREEIRDHCSKNNNNVTMDVITKMDYLDKVFKETLRMYPLVVTLHRKAMTKYTFKSANVTIPKDTIVCVPQYSLHRDPRVYPNPDAFDPERFAEDAVASRHPMYYIPFGDGPRNCIGTRLAACVTKLGIMTVIRNYKVDVCGKTTAPYQFKPHSFLLTPLHGIHLKLTKAES